MAKPLVAVVGRPNVGKSTLFNKLVGRRISIVEDTPGVTRDRIYAECEWSGRSFMLVDTGGLEPNTDDFMMSKMREQSKIAIETADVIIFICDITTGVTADDADVATILRKSGRPVVLCVNKADGVGKTHEGIYEFYNLALGDPIAVSSVHGTGTGDLLDAIIEHLPKKQESEENDEIINVAVIGKPNVGKSSLINKITGTERAIVSDIPGTTRDAIDTYFENNFGKYNFIDTAGLRKKSKIDENIEKYSVLRSLAAIERADVCVIMIDATEGITEQDTKVAGYAHESGKGCIIAVNKWDLVEKDDKTLDNMKKDIARDLAYMTYAPIIFISAQTGQRVDKLFEQINFVKEQNCMRISTGLLNEVLAESMLKVQPPTDKGKRLKILYATQSGIKPPTFVFFCNRSELFHFSYQRYIENQFRSVFGLAGTPVKMIIRERNDKK